MVSRREARIAAGENVRAPFQSHKRAERGNRLRRRSARCVLWSRGGLASLLVIAVR